MRQTALECSAFLAALSVLLLLGGCGGGAGGSPVPGGAAFQPGKVTGSVVQIDDDTSNRGGVQVRVLETGETITSAPDGSFEFLVSAPRAFTMALVGPSGAALLKVGDGGSGEMGGDDHMGHDAGHDEGHDEDGDHHEDGHDDAGHEDEDHHGDGHDADGHDDDDESTESEVHVHRIESGEDVHVRLRIRAGMLERVEISHSSHDEREVELFLERADTSDDADIRGKLEVEVRDDRQRIEVEVEHATPGRDLELFVLDPDDAAQSLGTLTVDTLGEAEWEINTGHGGVLPHGVASLEDLEGYGVEVRAAGTGTTLLRGVVPEIPASVPSREGDDDHHEGEHHDGEHHDGEHHDDAHDEDDADHEHRDDRERGRSPLTAVVSGLRGHVDVRSRPADSREVLEIKGEHLFAYASVEFLLEDGPASGIFRSLGVRTVDTVGEAELEIDTAEGDTLPNGATQVADLAGLGVEVRDVATGDLLLTGTVPALVQED